MRVKLTEQDRDGFKVASFRELDRLRLKIKNLSKVIEVLESELLIWKEMYLSDKSKTSQVLIANNDSEIHILIDKLSDTKAKIYNLCEKVETGEIDSVIKKEYYLLLPVLKEDLEIIQEKIEKTDKDNELFLENLNELELEYKNCRRELKDKNRELIGLIRRYTKILKNVKKVDELCEKKKKVPVRKLKLVKF